MSDYQEVDKYGYPLTTLQMLRRRQRGQPVQTKATERAGLTPVPVTVQELAHDAEPAPAAESEKPPEAA